MLSQIRALIAMGQCDLARYHLKKGCVLARSIESPVMTIEFLLEFGRFERKTRNFDACLEKVEEARNSISLIEQMRLRDEYTLQILLLNAERLLSQCIYVDASKAYADVIEKMTLLNLDNLKSLKAKAHLQEMYVQSHLGSAVDMSKAAHWHAVAQIDADLSSESSHYYSVLVSLEKQNVPHARRPAVQSIPAAPIDDYSTWKVAALKEKLKSLSLSTAGTKDVLVKRLMDEHASYSCKHQVVEEKEDSDSVAPIPFSLLDDDEIFPKGQKY
jgi:hypothetical protein